MTTHSTIVFDPMLPVGLVGIIGLALLVLTVFTYHQVGSRVGKGMNVLLMAFRLAGIALVLLVILQPSILEPVPVPEGKQITIVGVDTSRSMLQPDVEKQPRIEAARSLLMEAGVVRRDGAVADSDVRWFEFHEDAAPLTGSLLELPAKGETTRFHRSVNTMLNSIGPGETPQAVVLLTDGHDFEMVNPAKTAFLTRARQTPIYAVSFGGQGKARDVSVRITNYQPYCYVKQKARINAALRLVGCEHETINVALWRQGKVIQTQRVNADEQPQVQVQFEVTEPETGQFEYEIQAVPLTGETDVANNSAITFLNVIDQQIRVLVLEGSPYWDTTFLQRSLMRNDKVELDCATQYADKRARFIRKKNVEGELKIPATAEDFNRYDVIILGRAAEQLLNRKQLDALQTYVNELGGAVIFSRGKAFEGELADNELEPVVWDQTPAEQTRLQIGREGRALAPFRALAEQSGGTEGMPELIASRGIKEKKPLTAVLASAKDEASGQVTPAMVHRRYGRGQALSVGVDGLWRWAFNAKVEGNNTAFDRFWDQMLLWLMAARDVMPNRQFSLNTSAANLQLGEKAYFRLVMREPDPKVREVPIVFYHGEKEVGRTSLTATDPDEMARLSAEFLPEKTGKYRALARFPDGTSQESRFMVYNENLEETEVAADAAYLKKLCAQSGGRVLEPSELGRLLSDLKLGKLDTTPRTRVKTIWDQPWLFYLIGLLLGTDWFLRRRWGLC
ncbi:MAG: hypothetical protein AB1705_21570 [Verrucomicrobiota bacterium]